MAALLRCIQTRINHPMTCKKAGICGDSYLKLIDETKTFILNSITNYPHSITVETACALLASVVEDVDLFDLQARVDIVDSVNTKTNMSFTNIEISHSTTPSTSERVRVRVRVCVRLGVHASTTCGNYLDTSSRTFLRHMIAGKPYGSACVCVLL